MQSSKGSITHGIQLKAARVMLGMTVDEVANIAKLNRNSVLKAERPQSLAKFSFAASKIAKEFLALGIQFETKDGCIIISLKLRPEENKEVAISKVMELTDPRSINVTTIARRRAHKPHEAGNNILSGSLMTNDERRRLFRNYHRECDHLLAFFGKHGGDDFIQEMPNFPQECIGMSCGAKTRTGSECKRKDLFKNGRCRLHGGLSTGPKTLEGKRKSALNTGKTYEELLGDSI